MTSLLAGVVLLTSVISAQDTRAPNLIGLSPDSARILLNEDSFKFKILPELVYTDSLSEGVIAWQDPLHDSLLTDSLSVRLASPLTIKFPDLLGMQFVRAKALLDSLGFDIYQMGYMESEKYPLGAIAELSVKADSFVKRGTTIGMRLSSGKSDYAITKTSGGEEIRLIERPGFKIASVSLGTPDSFGFVLVFGLEITNPYPYAATLGKFKVDFKLNGVRITASEPDLTFSVSPKGTTKSKFRFPVPYVNINPSTARLFLGESSYRLVGVYNLTVESGFTQKPFDVTGNFAVFTSASDVKTRLEGIAASQ